MLWVTVVFAVFQCPNRHAHTEHFPVCILYFPGWLFETLSENFIHSTLHLAFVVVS